MEEVTVADFKYEEAMRATVEDSLGAIFPDLKIVGHEIRLKGYRFDTVAFNVKTRSFVLIEYKKVQNNQALAQGLAYLGVLNGNEGNFLQACKEKSDTKYEKKDVAWNKTRVFLVAPSFTDQLIKAVEQIREPIELYRVTKYENKLMTVEVIVGPKQGDEVKKPTKKVSEDGIYGELKKVLHEDLHLEKEDGGAYEKWLSKNGKTVCTVAKQVKSLVLCYTTKSLDRSEPDEVFVRHMVENGKRVGKRGSGDYMSKIQSVEDVNKAARYLEQVFIQKTESVSRHGRRTRDRLSNQGDTEYIAQKGSKRSARLYDELRTALFNSIPNPEIIVRKTYINWKSATNGKSICTVVVNKNALKLSYNTKQLDIYESDRGFVRHLFNDNKRTGSAGLGHYDSKIETSDDIERAIPYIKKVYMQKVE